MGTSCTLNWRNNIFNRTSSRLPYIQSISVMSLSVICLTGFIALWDMRLNWFNHRWIIYIHLIMNLPPHVPPLPCHVFTFHQKPLPTLNCTIQSCHLKCRSRGFVSVCWWVGVFASLHINPHLHISIIQFSPKRRVTGGEVSAVGPDLHLHLTFKLGGGGVTHIKIQTHELVWTPASILCF